MSAAPSWVVVKLEEGWRLAWRKRTYPATPATPEDLARPAVAVYELAPGPPYRSERAACSDAALVLLREP